MSIKYVILGFLSHEPLSGYDLKKKFVESAVLYWSGNNNQIYRALVQLHKDELVTQHVEYQTDNPPRKVYTITDAGLAALRDWALSAPELPQLRHNFLIQLMWTGQLSAPELDELLARYAEELNVAVLMLREQSARQTPAPPRTPRDAFLWEQIGARWLAFHEGELAWVHEVRAALAEADFGEA